jgi:DNA-directed RNA polymerase specialized sigma24 family protein
MNYPVFTNTKNHYESLSDDLLLQYFVKTDELAMAAMLTLNKDRIYYTIFSIIQDKSKAEEIYNQLFIQLFDNIMAGKSVHEGKFLALALQTAQKLSIEYSSREVQLKLMQQHDQSLHTQIPEPKMYIQHLGIRSIINLLPTQQREIIVWQHYAGLSFAEIAGNRSCSLNSVLETMRLALRHLQKLMLEREMAC